MKTLATLVIACAAASVTISASAQFAKPDDAIKYRQSALFVMQQKFSRVAAMAAGKTPYDAEVATESAAVAEFTAKLPWVGFTEGTDKGRDNRAKSEIWTDKARFNDYAEKMQAGMTKLSTAAKTGSLDNVKATMAGVGGSCKTCHDAFRKD